MSAPAEVLTQRPEARQKWRMFALGLGVRLIGLALIWLGNGSELWWRKGVVIVGVILSIGGIAVLRWLLSLPASPRLETNPFGVSFDLEQEINGKKRISVSVCSVAFRSRSVWALASFSGLNPLKEGTDGTQGTEGTSDLAAEKLTAFGVHQRFLLCRSGCR